jgi:predicted ATP-grasp superfamily ATP-dependent carboligase/SAM-dependent methyltransferase
MTKILIFSGFNMRAVIAFIRTLEELQLDYSVIACTGDDPIFKTSYRSRVVATRPSPELETETILELLGNVIEQQQAERYLIAPSSEALNRFLLCNRQKLLSMHVDVPLTEQETYLTVSDKLSFQDICERKGIDVPVGIDPNTEVTFPFVAKPKAYFSKSAQKTLKPVLIGCHKDFAEFKLEHSMGDFFFQEYVDGSSFYILFYFYKDGRQPLAYSQENLVQQKAGGSILAATSSDIHVDKIAGDFRELFEELKFSGLVMVELRGSRASAKMIEANPRFWGPSQLFVDAGVNFFEAFLADHGFNLGETSIPANTATTRYFWDDGESFNNGEIADTAFHNYAPDELKRTYEQWDQVNLFNRPDTIGLYREFTRSSEMATSSSLARLRTHYNKASKHSNYQILAPALAPLIPSGDLETHSRYEKERFDAICGALDLQDKSVLDIGGNTGYFTFEALRAGAQVTYFEGNCDHARFVAMAADVLDENQNLTVHDDYYLFDGLDRNRYDTVFLLNVLHHVGDDYDDSSISINQAKSRIIDSLKNMARITDKLIFQLGFNWKGNIELPLFAAGTNSEMTAFLKSKLADTYQIDAIFLADKNDGEIVYRRVEEEELQRRDELGEFLNRPLYIMSSIL